jgi:transposase
LAARAPRFVIGVDLGDRSSHVFALDTLTGQVLGDDKIPTTQDGFRARFTGQTDTRVVIEAGTHSRWVAALLEEELALEVLVANPRKLKAISASGRRKNDQLDAELLARLGNAEPSLLAPIQHRSKTAHVDMLSLRARDLLVAQRTQVVNFVRSQVKTCGVRLDRCDAKGFHRRVAEQVPSELKPALDPLLEVLKALEVKIDEFDAAIAEIAKDRYGEDVRRLRQVSGVGPIISLAFVLTVDDPARFQKNRDVGAYLGLCPGLKESGAGDPQLRITKAGDGFTRRLLVQGAQRILGVGPDTDLKRWGLRIAERGGKNGRRRAVIAVARKLAVLLLRLWKSGETYVPLRECTDSGSSGEAA